MTNFVYADIDREFNTTLGGEYVIQYDSDAIIQSIKNIISTISGERVRNPIGSTLIRLLFEPMNDETADSIKTMLFKSIQQHEPRVSIQDIRVIPDYNQQTYTVFVQMNVKKLTKIVRFETKLRSLYA